MDWLTTLLIFLSLIGLLAWASQSFRYVLKFYIYALCICISGFIGSLICAKNGVTSYNTRLMFTLFKYSVFWTGLKFDTRNLEELETDEPCIVVANHQSAIDVICMGYVWPKNCSVILKKSLKYLPGFNICAYLCDAIYIDRLNKEKAHKSIDDALYHVKNKKNKIFIFPEGTRNSNDELLPFKKGAFILATEANVPIIPVVFSRYKNFYNHDERRFDYGGRIIVKALKPMYPKDYPNLEAFSEECRKRMTAELDELDKELLQTSNKKD